jgi:hypothetical protein
VVYVDASYPHPDCAQHLQAIDFRLEAFGRALHDTLVKAWWDDTGFAGRCPTRNRWIHFTIRGKRAISNAEAAKLPQLPENWASEAVILQLVLAIGKWRAKKSAARLALRIFY